MAKKNQKGGDNAADAAGDFEVNSPSAAQQHEPINSPVVAGEKLETSEEVIDDAIRLEKATNNLENLVELPSNLKDAFKALQEADALPERNPKEERFKAKALSIIRPHIAKLQQGLPVLPNDSDSYGHSVGNHAASLRQHRLESMARTHPEIKELIKERDGLAKPSGTPEQIAEALYNTYCNAVGKAATGDLLPDWKTFRADEKKKTQSDAWVKVAERVRSLT